MEIPTLAIPTLTGFHFAFALTSSSLLVALGVFSFLYLIVSAILYYHWISYGMGSHGIVVGEILYLVVAVLLFVTAFLSASYY